MANQGDPTIPCRDPKRGHAEEFTTQRTRILLRQFDRISQVLLS